MATVVERIPIDDMRHELFVEQLDLVPVRPNSAPYGWVWLDRNTGLSFELEREKNAREDTGSVFGYWHFSLWHPNHPKVILLWHFSTEVLRAPEGRLFRHKIDRSDAFSWTDKHVDDREAVFATIAALGGRDALFDFCLKAIRAATCRPVRIETDAGGEVVRILRCASEVEFVVHG